MGSGRLLQSSWKRHDGWFRSLAECAGVAVFVYCDQRLIWVNRAGEELTGYDRDRLLAMKLTDLLEPDGRDALGLDRDEEGFYIPTSRPVEVRIRRSRGESCWAAVTFGVVSFGGRRAGFTTAVDISRRRQAEEQLADNLEQLELALKAGTAAAWSWDIETDRMDFSSHTREIMGWPTDQVPTTGNEFLERVPAEDRAAISGEFRCVFASGEPYSIEHRILYPGGSVRWVAVQGHPQRNAAGRVIRVVGVSADVTARKAAERALRQEKERAQVTLSSISDGVIRSDVDGVVDFLNPAAERLTGMARNDAIGRTVEEVYRVVAEDGRAPMDNPVRRCLELSRPVQSLSPCNLVTAGGGEIAVRDSAAPLFDASGAVVGAVLVFTDFTRLRILEKEMAYLACHDPLTGLINRREFEQRLMAVIDSGAGPKRRFALGYLDLDDFKIVNDTCGHGAGDELLRQLTSVLEATMVAGDTLARLGGDEFGLILVGCSVPEAVTRAGAVLDAIRRFRFMWDERIFDVRASIGIVTVTEAGGSMSELLSAADAACFVAKDRGRNQIHLSEPDDAEVAARTSEMQWVQRIRHALDQERLVLYFQRIRPLRPEASTRMVEVLLRLLDTNGRIVAPGQFLSAAERYNLMPTMDSWVIRNALRVIARVAVDLPDLVFAINLSGQSMGNAEIGQLILAEVERNRIKPGRLLFEITETAAISNLRTAQSIIDSLSAHGCRFVLDDFGSGLSSFRYLRNLKVSFLKIDGDLVAQVARDPIQREMVTAIHRVGETMGLQTIGEWVESRDVAETLQEIGVHFGQGFWFHRPEPITGLGTGDPDAGARLADSWH